MTEVASLPPAPAMSAEESALIARVRRLVAQGTTDLASASLRVPLEYYRSPDLLAAGARTPTPDPPLHSLNPLDSPGRTPSSCATSLALRSS